jgi:hypothetical protein
MHSAFFERNGWKTERTLAYRIYENALKFLALSVQFFYINWRAALRPKGSCAKILIVFNFPVL